MSIIESIEKIKKLSDEIINFEAMKFIYWNRHFKNTMLDSRVKSIRHCKAGTIINYKDGSWMWAYE